MPEVKAILFDLFETLVTESHVGPTRASTLGPALGLTPQEYRPAWKARRPRIVVGELSFAEALTDISMVLLGTADAATIERLCLLRIQEKQIAYSRLDDKVCSLVAGLGRRRIKLGVVSNGFAEDVRGWPECALAPAFESSVFSCEEGVAKPDPEIYRRALRRLDVEPADAIYVGDGGDDELTGAQMAGLRAYRAAWFVPHLQRQAAFTELAVCDDLFALVERG